MGFYNTTTVKILPALNPLTPRPHTTPPSVSYTYTWHTHIITHTLTHSLYTYVLLYHMKYVRNGFAARVEYEMIAFDPERETRRTARVALGPCDRYNDILLCDVAIILTLCYHRSTCLISRCNIIIRVCYGLEFVCTNPTERPLL